MTGKRKLLTLKPRLEVAFLGLKPSQSRQAKRALHTGSQSWRRVRAEVLRRDLYRCQGWPRGTHADGCNGIASEVDHISGDASQHVGIDALQSLSRACHSVKTAREDGGFGNLKTPGGGFS